jgi:Rha family phage regulatory protein
MGGPRAFYHPIVPGALFLEGSMKNVPSVIDGIEFKVNGCVKVSSRQVAEKFNKRHADVLRAVSNLDCSAGFNERNYASVKYEDKKGEDRAEFFMTRDGFMFLAMGFKGKEAAKWKEDIISAFNKMEAYIIKEEERKHQRALATMRAPEMTDAVKELKESEGKELKPYHFSNEFDMINRIVLGVTAKKWRAHMEIEKGEAFRDALTPLQIEAVQNLQTANTVLIETGMPYKKRKEHLEKIYKKKFAEKCLNEILEMNR